MTSPRRGRFIRIITRAPFRDEHGRKGLFERFSHARPHIVRRLTLNVPGWPHWPRPLRIAFLSDFHFGSHSGDIARFKRIVAEAAALAPDLVLFGGDYVNLQPFGGGRVPPRVIAAILAELPAHCGRFAVLGNHDVKYGEREAADALRGCGITVLADERTTFSFAGHMIGIVGIPDAKVTRQAARVLLAKLPAKPTIIVAHDPVWFADLPAGPFLMLSGHTHGGQIKLPGIGILTNGSKAPRHWSHGLVVEGNKHLYVTSGLGTSNFPLRIGVPPEYVLIEITSLL